MNVVNIAPPPSYEHITLRLPLRAASETMDYQVIDWSVTGFRISGFDEQVTIGSMMLFKLLFPFDAFNLSLSVNAKIARNSRASKTAELTFQGLTKRQSELLQYISDAYLSGELVSAGDVIEVVARTPSALEMPKAAEPKTATKRARRAFGRFFATIAFGAAAIALAVYLASSAYERLFVVPAVSGLVTINTTELTSPAAGIAIITASGASLKVGDPVAEVTTLNGEIVKIASPCKCTITSNVESGPMPVAAGARILSLSHDNSAPQISAFVRYEDLLQLYRGASIKVFFADGTVSRDATIASLPPLSPESSPAGSLVEIDVNAGAKLQREMIGQPVYVLFDTGPF